MKYRKTLMLERFRALTTLLLKHQVIWKTAVFPRTDFAYLCHYHDVLDYLSNIADHQIDDLQANDHDLLQGLGKVFPDALNLAELTHFSQAAKRIPLATPAFWNTDIPGRKEQQVLAFSRALGRIDQPLLEWCCGKQHLSRLLAEVHQQPALGLDIDQDLIAQARILADKRHLSSTIESTCCDVLSDQVEQHIHAEQHLIALHACGGLHTRLLELAAKHRVTRLSFSPCCYHRFLESADYQPLSQAGLKSGLGITQEELRLAVRETQTASKSETLKRKTLQAWRLGFDCLQRDILQTDRYLPTPSLSSKVLQQGFQSFCEHLAQLKELEIKAGINFDRYQEQGMHRFQRYQRVELFRMVFRRALECWLVVDKALFLEEQGYACEISQFCSADISPRNLLIKAKRNQTLIQKRN